MTDARVAKLLQTHPVTERFQDHLWRLWRNPDDRNWYWRSGHGGGLMSEVLSPVSARAIVLAAWLKRLAENYHIELTTLGDAAWTCVVFAKVSGEPLFQVEGETPLDALAEALERTEKA